MNVTLTNSDQIAIVSSAFSAASILYAIYERIQVSRARKEAGHFRHLLLLQEISRQFADVPKRAIDLFTLVKENKWTKAAETALLLSADLASLNGIQPELIGETNKDQLETALNVMGEINRNIPRSAAPIEPEI